MPISTKLAAARGRHSGLQRAVRNGERNANDPIVIEAARDLHVAKLTDDADRLAERAAHLVATWPELTPEQRDRIAAIMAGGATQ